MQAPIYVEALYYFIYGISPRNIILQCRVKYFQLLLQFSAAVLQAAHTAFVSSYNFFYIMKMQVKSWQLRGAMKIMMHQDITFTTTKITTFLKNEEPNKELYNSGI